MYTVHNYSIHERGVAFVMRFIERASRARGACAVKNGLTVADDARGADTKHFRQ
jgi:hypothetical protein